MNKILLFAIVAICTAGCTTTRYNYEFKISSQAVTPGFSPKYHCRVDYMNGDEKTIEGKFYIGQTENLLKNEGIILVDKNNEKRPDCIIAVAHATNFGKEQRMGYTWGQTGISSSTSHTNAYMSSYNVGNTIYGSGHATTNTTYNPTYGITGTYSYDVARSYIAFAMVARDAQTEEEMWKISVLHPGHVDNKFVGIFPIIKCIVSHYLYRNYNSSLWFSEEELNKIIQGHCNLIEWPNEPTFADIMKEAKRGKAEYQFYLGKMYYEGRLTDIDTEQAIYWFTKAAEQDYLEAQMALGAIYHEGQGIDKDYSKSFYWISKAAEQGNAVAQGNLGYMYYWGEGTSKDFPSAFYWFTKASAQGNIEAQLGMALMYYKGEGVKQDLKKAFDIYSRPDVKDELVAEARLSCYDESIQSPQQHFEKCLVMAKQGNAKAQYAVASSYYNGAGTNQDINKTYMWLEKAAAQDSKYEDVRQEIEAEISNKM